MSRQGPRARATREAVTAGLLGLLALSVGGAACAQKRPSSFPNRFVRGVDGPVDVQVPPAAAEAVREFAALSALDPVAKSSELPTLEKEAAALSAALSALGRQQTPDSLRIVAAEYHRLGVYDQAHKYLTRALVTKPSDSDLLDARARVSRDWGLLEPALADATRAVYFAPKSASAKNTLGTVLFGLGKTAEALAAFDDAVTLDATATFALNNACYVALVAGNEELALSRCHAALAQDPGLTAARNNLALVHASAGRLDDARREFVAAGSLAAAEYNFGMVLMARREYDRALEAFQGALREMPRFDEAFARAQEARARAARAVRKEPN